MKERKTIYDSSALKLDNVKAYLLTYCMLLRELAPLQQLFIILRRLPV